ncbi:unnamed protein product [Ilex paraguariensis]|uniref:Uncharacterized protein n=1 Tax=Ilex paraguariensis TaxID=185542 RepID=A0ABC8UMP9_9AQUA
MVADLAGPAYKLELTSPVPSVGMQPKATLKFPLGEVSLEDKVEEEEEAKRMLSLNGILKGYILNGVCNAEYKDKSLNFTYSYKDEQMAFIPHISLPSNSLSFAFKRQFGPSDKLSYWYNFESCNWSAVYKHTVGKEFKLKAGYDSEVRLGWASLWAQQGEVSMVADLAGPAYKLELTSPVPSVGMQPKATLKFPLGEVSLEDKVEEEEEAKRMLSLNGILKGYILNGVCNAEYKDKSLNFTYSYKDEQMAFIPHISLPSNSLSFAFKRQFGPSDKLSYWYNFESCNWSAVYKHTVGKEFKLKAGYDSEVRLGWASLWAQQGEVAMVADLAGPAYKLELTSPVPSVGMQPKATLKFPLGEVSLEDKVEEEEEAKRMLSLNGILKGYILNGVCNAEYKDKSLNFTYSYKDEQMAFIPHISLPSNSLSFAFKRQFGPSDKLSYWYNFESSNWSAVYKHTVGKEFKLKAGYDSEVRLGWASLWHIFLFLCAFYVLFYSSGDKVVGGANNHQAHSTPEAASQSRPL